MKIVLRQVPGAKGRVEIVEIDGTADEVPPEPSYDSEKAAIRSAAQDLGLISDEFDEVVYET